MSTSCNALLHITVEKGLPVALSFLDDALLLLLSKIGIPLPGLDWLGWFLLACTILHWTVRFLYNHFKLAAAVGEPH